MLRRACSSASQVVRAPFQVQFTDNAGRGVFASREIPPAQLILSEKPTVVHPSLACVGKVCAACLRRLETSSNDKAFCSQECATEAKEYWSIENGSHWSDFHDYCRENSLRFPLLVKRLACMVTSQALPHNALDILYPPSPLNPPADLQQRWSSERKLLTKAMAASGIQKAALNFLTESWYAEVISKIHLNTFRVETLDSAPTDLHKALLDSVTGDNVVGSAVYILASMFNHSCDANVHISWPDNSTAKLETLRTIEPGEQLFITYIDASMACESRKRLLQEAYGFHCECPRCGDGD